MDERHLAMWQVVHEPEEVPAAIERRRVDERRSGFAVP